jgi:hypothetical protein
MNGWECSCQGCVEGHTRDWHLKLRWLALDGGGGLSEEDMKLVGALPRYEPEPRRDWVEMLADPLSDPFLDLKLRDYMSDRDERLAELPRDVPDRPDGRRR